MKGTQLGPYRVADELGRGGMGTVYLAEVTRPTSGLAVGTRVALKVIHPQLLETEGFFKRFLREAEIGQRVRDANVVRCHDCDSLLYEGAQTNFMVMEYVEGQTLREMLDELGPLPEELCRHIGLETARGLAAIHAAGVVHRDVKPENVLITGEHVVKVMDLGVARLADEQLRLTQTGMFVGSVQYAAPEQFTEQDALDGRTDLHALGVTLYELATGQNPFLDKDLQKTLKRVLHEDPRRCAEVNPQLSPFFEELVHALLAKDRDARFRSAADLIQVFDEGEDSAWWRVRAREIRADTKRPLRRIRIPRETALYGRESAIATLRAQYERAKAGDGNVVLVEGEAGIGKSRLVDEFVGILQREGEDVNFLFGSFPPGGAATASGAFSTAYREQFGAEGLEDVLAAYLSETPALIPAFAALLRGEGVPSGAEGLTKDSLQTVFINSTRALAAERTTIVLIDDLHFAPEEGRSLLAALALAAPGHRVLLVGATRPGMDEQWLAALDRIGASRLPLARLGPKDLSGLLVDALSSEHLAEELAYKIGSKSDGNPFFVFEILRGLREGQFLSQRPDGAWMTTSVIAEIEIPSSLIDLVHARVADLDDDERNMLDVAACVGFEFDPLLVAQVLGLKKIPAMQALAKIEKKHRLVRSSGRRFVFDQHQVQEACYDGLPEILREEYHAEIAESLLAQHGVEDSDPATLAGALSVDLAQHFFLADRSGRALPYLDGALSHLDQGFQHDAALELEGRALAAEGLLKGIERWNVLQRRARRLDVVGRPAEEVQCLEEAIGLADAEDDPLLRARVRNELGDLFRRLARFDDAQSALHASLELYRESGNRKGEATVTVNLGIVAWALGRFDEALPHLEVALATARDLEDRELETTATQNLAVVLYSLGRHDEARSHYEQALELSQKLGQRQTEVQAAANLGLACVALGRYDEACSTFERALSLSREIGYRPGEAHATVCLGSIYRSLGRYDPARAHLERYLALSREFGDRAGEATAMLYTGLVCADVDAYDEAREHMQASLAICRDTGWRWGEAHALAAIGASYAQEGKAAEAETTLKEAASLAEEVTLPCVQYVSCAWLATLPVTDADAAQAVDCAMQAVTSCEGKSGISEGMLARFLLWKATQDRTHLEEAKRRLDHLVLHAPRDDRTSMVEKVRLHREITEAALSDPTGS